MGHEFHSQLFFITRLVKQPHKLGYNLYNYDFLENNLYCCDNAPPSWGLNWQNLTNINQFNQIWCSHVFTNKIHQNQFVQIDFAE
jgi:acyl CoA:acetate/3-ketoacid CoA transferase alpha subunit